MNFSLREKEFIKLVTRRDLKSITEFYIWLNDDHEKKKQEHQQQGKYYNVDIQQFGLKCVQEYITDSIRSFIWTLHEKPKYQENIEIYKERLEYFKSEKFLDKLLSKIPSNDGLPSKGKQGYGAFLSDLFDFQFKKNEARHMLENGFAAQQQCLTALQEYTSTGAKVPFDTLWGLGNKYCYICGIKMGNIKEQETMECEHILPMITAISNWWLLQKKHDFVENSDDFRKRIRLEYDWSHMCCNRIKSDKNFIQFNFENGKDPCTVNEKIIRNLFKNIQEKGKQQIHEIGSLDCPQVMNTGKDQDNHNENSWAPDNTITTLKPGFGPLRGRDGYTMNIEARVSEVRKRVQPIVDIINAQIKSFTTNNLETNKQKVYDVLCKMKLVSALSTHFDQLILAEDKKKLDGIKDAYKNSKEIEPSNSYETQRNLTYKEISKNTELVKEILSKGYELRSFVGLLIYDIAISGISELDFFEKMGVLVDLQPESDSLPSNPKPANASPQPGRIEQDGGKIQKGGQIFKFEFPSHVETMTEQDFQQNKDDTISDFIISQSLQPVTNKLKLIAYELMQEYEFKIQFGLIGGSNAEIAQEVGEVDTGIVQGAAAAAAAATAAAQKPVTEESQLPKRRRDSDDDSDERKKKKKAFETKKINRQNLPFHAHRKWIPQQPQPMQTVKVGGGRKKTKKGKKIRRSIRKNKKQAKYKSKKN